MKLEYLSNINSEFPDEDLIRLFNFNQKEAKQFQKIIRDKIVKSKETVDLANYDFIKPINCSLSLTLSEQDKGIQRIGKDSFVCYLTKGSYQKMVDLIQPFIESDQAGYQWLYELDGDTTPTELLFSKNGSW